MKQPIVEVVWRDAFGSNKWHDIRDHADGYIIHTIGYLLWEDKHYLGTGASITPEEETVANTTHIPKTTILSLKFLRGKPRK